MVDKGTVIQVFGSLMQRPSFLLEKDKYSLTPADFNSAFEKTVFVSIYSLFENGAQQISVVDVDNYLSTNPTSKALFEKNGGIEYLEDAVAFSDPNNFPFYYRRLKKFSVVRDLKAMGYDTSKIYDEDLVTDRAKEINDRFEEMETHQIFENIKKEIMEVESRYGRGKGTTVHSADEEIVELLEQLKVAPDLGAPLQGEIFNTICRGARKGRYYIRSAGTSTGKSRMSVGDACYLAYPIRFNPTNWSWEVCGSSERTVYIMTEQEKSEIQTMILAYLTGFNEEKFLFNQYTVEEEKIIQQAIQVMEAFRENLILVEMPNPTIEGIRSLVREQWLLNDIENVFFDYIFICPSLLNEFRDLRLRNDEVLAMVSTALKDLSVELSVFILTSTQLNAKGEDDESEIKGVAAIRGSRAILDKADIGVIVSRVTSEQSELLSNVISETGRIPNQVIDVYKVRQGRFTQVKIWIDSDLGTCRRKDLFVTDGRYNRVNDFVSLVYESQKDTDFLTDLISKIERG